MHLGVLSRPSNFHAEKWASALARVGARVTLLTLDAPTAVAGVEVVQLKPPIVWGGRYRYPSYGLTSAALYQQLRRRGIDVLHPLHLTPFGTWAVQSGFTPTIAAAMGADVLEYPPRRGLEAFERTWREADRQHSAAQRWRAWLLNRYYRRQVAQVIARADLLTGDNLPLVEAMRDWFGAPMGKLRLLRWGLEPDRFASDADTQARVRERFGIAPHRRVVLSPRGANALYQGDVILGAFEALFERRLERLADLHVIMLGAGYEVSSEVRRRAEALAAREANFSFVADQMPRQMVYDLWSVTDVFLSAPVYDGYSAAVAEGRYAGAIPVVNDIPGNREVITHGENGWIVDPFTVEGLTGALAEVIDRRAELRAQFGPRNRAWIEQHSLLDRNAARLVTWADALRRGLPVPD